MNRYFDIISGNDRAWTADLIRLALRTASIPYAIVSELRHLGYERGVLPVRSVPVPVISIGNLTTGGTGKTPTVAWLVQRLMDMGAQPGIVSRGYRSLDGQENDEKRLLDEMFPDVPHVQNPSRIRAAEQMLATSPVNVIVLDDAFQHRQLHRDLDIVLIDALNPWGYGALLPRGLLRERIGRLSRADVIFVTRCELVGHQQVEDIIERIRPVTSAPIVRTRFAPQYFVNASREILPLDQVAERKRLAFCGIGNPDGFRRTLNAVSLQIDERDLLGFPDHHHYSPEDIRKIVQYARGRGAEVLLTTRKDLVKIQRDDLEGIPLWALDIGLTFLDDATFLTGLLRTMLTSR